MHRSLEQKLSTTLFVALAMMVSAPTSAQVTGVNTPPGGNQPLYIGANGGVYVTVLPSGYVGIGTTNPILPLQVVGNAQFGISNSGDPSSLQIIATGISSPVSARTQFGTDGTGWQYRIAKNSGRHDL